MQTKLISTILIFSILGLNGCVTKHVYHVPDLDISLSASCPKPTTINKDLGFHTATDIEKELEAQVNSKVMRSYFQTKNDHIACYKSMVNVHSAYEKLKKETLSKNKK